MKNAPGTITDRLYHKDFSVFILMAWTCNQKKDDLVGNVWINCTNVEMLGYLVLSREGGDGKDSTVLGEGM